MKKPECMEVQTDEEAEGKALWTNKVLRRKIEEFALENSGLPEWRRRVVVRRRIVRRMRKYSLTRHERASILAWFSTLEEENA